MDKRTKQLLFTLFVEGPVFVGIMVAACYAAIILAYLFVG